MIDIISYIRERILHRPKLVSEVAGEELSEKQTTKLGYFLLYCMFGAILTSAQWTLSIIRDIPEKPTTVPICVTDMLYTLGETPEYNSFSSYSYYQNNCELVSTKPKFDFTLEYKNLLPVLADITNYSKQISGLESQKQNARYNQRNSQEDYNTALAEKTARENSGLYDSEKIQENIRNSRTEATSAESEISHLKQLIESKKSEYRDAILALQKKEIQAQDDYQTSYLLYKLIIALLSFIFVLTVFVVLYRIYVQQKIKNSPFTIIFSVATFAYGLVLLQVSFLFIWDIIPHRLLVWIANIFEIFTPLIYIVQFLWPILIIAIFGYLVFRIQKRLYSPQNILKRFISDKKCQNCGNAVDFTKPFCPLCAHEIQAHCPHCHELSLKGMPYCSNCGGKLPEKDHIAPGQRKVFDEFFEKELGQVDIHEYRGVNFLPKDGASFVSNRENIVRLSIYVIGKMGKSSFEPGEFAPYFDTIMTHLHRDNIENSELKRVTGKIRSWITSGGEIELLKK